MQGRDAEDPFTVDTGFWRYWAGSRHRFGRGYRLDTELAFLAGPSSGDPPRWRVALGKTFDGGASATLTVYNLESTTDDGYGGLLSGYVPLGTEGRLTLQPSLGFRTFDGPGGNVVDLRLFADYLLADRWNASFGITQLLGDTPESTTLEFAVRYRW
jgi:hypothetical protein